MKFGLNFSKKFPLTKWTMEISSLFYILDEHGNVAYRLNLSNDNRRQGLLVPWVKCRSLPLGGYNY